ncbi:MAG: SRPBCC domain-containing protein [Candidatus Methanoperedens sp.]|nr:SRPBCC domain-containing protein [Candidatus Methanoperedens sp.]
MKIKLNSILVDDQDKALKFYTEVLGFVKKQDFPVGEFKWLTVVSPEEPDGTELVLEPMGFPPARTYQKELFDAGIPLTAFAVEDIQKEYERMKNLRVVFKSEPTEMEQTTQAVFDDTCGNLIQIYQTKQASKGLIAKASITFNVSIAKVWDALVNPDKIKQYMFGTNTVSDWKEGSSIVWKGEWEGKKYEDKGVILRLEPGHLIQYSHFSPLTGQPDLPENYHIVTIELSGKGKQTYVSLLQDNNATEEAREHSEKNWNMLLEGLKTFLEK